MWGQSKWITRSDGSKQTTFRGWPLYFFVGDAKAGDVKGEGVGNVWFVLREEPYSILLMSNAPGPEPEPYLSDGTGRSLYQFFQDTAGTASSDPVSACTVRCLVNWPIFLLDAAVVPSRLATSDFTVFTPTGSGSPRTKAVPCTSSPAMRHPATRPAEASPTATRSTRGTSPDCALSRRSGRSRPPRARGTKNR